MNSIQIIKNETNSFGDQIFEAHLVNLDNGQKLDSFYVLNHEGSHESFMELLNKANNSLRE